MALRAGPDLDAAARLRVNPEPEEPMMLLDVRVYTIHRGKRDEFDALARDETIPLARRHGHRIVAFGPSAHDDNSYYLIRAFASAEERARALASLYGSDEWLGNYDSRAMALIHSYATAVISTSEDAVLQLAAASPSAQ